MDPYCTSGTAAVAAVAVDLGCELVVGVCSTHGSGGRELPVADGRSPGPGHRGTRR